MDTSQNLLMKDILAEAITMGASDLHFSVGNYPVLRVGQELRYLENREIINQSFVEKLVEVLLSAPQKETLQKNKEIVISYTFDKNLRFKVTIFFQRGFLSASLRYIPTRVPTLSELNIDKTIKKFAAYKHGLVIICGPFGSGRSSTIAALIEEINSTRKAYILTIEDPIEYVFANNQSIIEQREVGRDTNSFSDALKYFQEEDGDVLFLEQLSDKDIIPMALDIASGNSLVITAMAADTVVKAVSQILDSFTSFDQERVRDKLAGALKVVVCQKIIPKIGGGLKVVCEIMPVNDTVKSTIAKGSIGQLDNIMQTSRKEGMVSFNQALLDAVNAQEITAADAIANAPDPESFEKLIRQ